MARMVFKPYSPFAARHLLLAIGHLQSCTTDLAMTPEVSVVMPVRNGARWLRDAVESVLSQTFTDLELLIIDDGSADETSSIAEEYARGDRRVHIIRQSGLGLVAALNRGISEARAPFIARLDSDDLAASERIERQLGFLRTHPEIGLLGSWAEKIDARGKHVGWLKPETRPRELIAILQSRNPFIHSSIMLRTEIARRLGGYRGAFKAAEDYDLWLRVAEVTTIANLPEVLIRYRWHAGNVIKRDALRQAFSARLAQNCAEMRREGFGDPANHISAPPDWHSPCAQTAFYSRDAEIYRLLDPADRDPAQLADLDFSLLIARFDELSHAERKLALAVMINYIRRARGPAASRARRLLLRLLRQRPGAILPLVRGVLHVLYELP